jgi:hypothetical protein
MLAYGAIFQTALARVAELQWRALLDGGAVLRAAGPAAGTCLSATRLEQ